ALMLSNEDLPQGQGDERIEYILKRALDANLLPPGIGIAEVQLYRTVYRANARAVRQYVPQVYPGIVTLFKTTKHHSTSTPEGPAGQEQITGLVTDPTRGWGKLAAQGVRIVEIPGEHKTMLNKPHVET